MKNTLTTLALFLVTLSNLFSADFQEFSYGDKEQDIKDLLIAKNKVIIETDDGFDVNREIIGGYMADIYYIIDKSDSTLTAVFLYFDHEESRTWHELTEALISKYGNPNEKTFTRMSWSFNNGNTISITREGYLEDCTIYIYYLSERYRYKALNSTKDKNKKTAKDL